MIVIINVFFFFNGFPFRPWKLGPDTLFQSFPGCLGGNLIPAGGAAHHRSALTLSFMCACHASRARRAPARRVSAVPPVSWGSEYQRLPTLNSLSRVRTSNGSQEGP